MPDYDYERTIEAFRLTNTLRDNENSLINQRFGFLVAMTSFLAIAFVTIITREAATTGEPSTSTIALLGVVVAAAGWFLTLAVAEILHASNRTHERLRAQALWLEKRVFPEPHVDLRPLSAHQQWARGSEEQERRPVSRARDREWLLFIFVSGAAWLWGVLAIRSKPDLVSWVLNPSWTFRPNNLITYVIPAALLVVWASGAIWAASFD